MTQTTPTTAMPSLEDTAHGMSIQRIAALETPAPLSATLASTAAPAAEPGYTTTEFAVSVVVAFIGVLTSFGVVHLGTGQQNQLVGFLEMVIPAVGYAISRGIRKAGTPG